MTPNSRAASTVVLASAEQAVAWLHSRVALPMPGELRTDSRQVGAGDIFIAWPGARHDARRHVAAALRSGALACLVEADGVEAFGFADERIASLSGLKAAAGSIAHLWTGRPSHALQVLAVTGTNGKTSVSWWLSQALNLMGRRCGLVGTLGMGDAATPTQPLQATGLTTPDAVTLHNHLRHLVDGGAAACALEASSIGLMEHRLDGLHIDVALFTNLTQDHLDYHGTMAAYGDAKRRLFNWTGLRQAVINIDDAHGLDLAATLRRQGRPVISVSLDGRVSADGSVPTLQGSGLVLDAEGMTFEAVEGGQRVTVRSPMVGRFNASNLMVVLGGLRALDVPLQQAAQLLALLSPVPGRMQRLSALASRPVGDVEVVVDYAHTPDALKQALSALQPLALARGGRLWCVVGCGGGRDAGKRPQMGAIAQDGAQHLVLTSDNPRHENPALILQQMLGGCARPHEVVVVADRRAAIRHAIEHADAADVVLLAGKGHEEFQEIAGVKLPFSDVEEARLALVGRQAGLAGGLVVEGFHAGAWRATAPHATVTQRAGLGGPLLSSSEPAPTVPGALC